MNCNRLVEYLLESDLDGGDYTPEGYELMDTARAGEHVLKLWRGEAHVDGVPVKFYEVSLNARGLAFDPDSQFKHHKTDAGGLRSALGNRTEMMTSIARWITAYGELYIGSHVPDKLATYHHLFKRYMPRFSISVPYAPFDECEGKSEYFKVTAPRHVTESILREENADELELKSLADRVNMPSDTERYFALNALVANVRQGIQSGFINRDNFFEQVDDMAVDAVYSMKLEDENEEVRSLLHQQFVQSVLNHVRQPSA